MDDLLNVILRIERKLLCSYLFKQEQSNEDFKLWSNGLKPLLMGHHLNLIEELIEEAHFLRPPIRCRQCRSPLEWISADLTADHHNMNEVLFVCIGCHNAAPIFRCQNEDTCSILVDLLDTQDPQILASAINLILIGGNMLNSLSPPFSPENPIELVQSSYEHSPSVLKFGGTKAVIIADIYEDTLVKDFPILYLADTVTIPTRYYLRALKYRSHSSAENYNNNNNKGDGGDDCNLNDSGEGSSRVHIDCASGSTRIPPEEYLLEELIEIGNKCMQSGSCLVLGPTLQTLISTATYNRRLHNLAMVIPFDELRPLDGKSNREFHVADNFDEVSKPAIKLCKIVFLLVWHAKEPNERTHGDALYDEIQQHLTAAIWLKTFSGTPFESLLFHIVDGGTKALPFAEAVAAATAALID